jgi:DNA-binding NtrC family response regulator
VEKRMLFKTLAFFDNNKSRAARALGVTAKTIYNRLSAYGQAEAEDGPAGEIEETDDEPERQ